MSLAERDRQRFAAALDALRSKELSAEEAAWLRSVVLNDADARRAYAETLWLSANLAWLTQNSIPVSEDAPSPPATPPLTPEVYGGLTEGRRIRGWSLAVSMVSVALLVYSGFGLLVWQMGWAISHRGDEQSSPTNVVGTLKPAIARVAALTGATPVSPDTPLPLIGQALNAGDQLELASGTVEVELGNGVQMVLEGPSDLTLISTQSMHLNQGRLFARVPQEATGFTVETAAGRVIDRGTEFGVELTPQGALHVEVLVGHVEVHQATTAGASPPVQLRSGQALLVNQHGTPTTAPFVSQKRFASLQGALERENERVEVLLHYRLGEDDSVTETGKLAPLNSEGKGSVGVHHPLVRYGQPVCTAVADVPDRWALQTSGNVAEGYVTRGLPRMPVDNWVLEAWLRPRSLGEGEPVYLGHSSLDGYGLLIHKGRWAGLCGSRGMAFSEAPVVLNKWTHVAWVHENGRAQLFVDGVPSGPAHRLEPKAPEGTLRVGYRDENFPISFDGEIDAVRLMRIKRLFKPHMLLYSSEPPQKR